MDDQELVQLFLNRSDVAIRKLESQYGAVMFSISYNILQNREDAEECVNDAYLALWNAIPPAQPHSLFSFSCKFVRNISLTKYKYNTAEKRNIHKIISWETVEDCIPENMLVSEETERERLTKIWNDWLGKLNRENRYIFIRKYWYMDSVSQIAKKIKLSEAAIYLRIDRMKKGLAKYLKQKGVFYEKS